MELKGSPDFLVALVSASFTARYICIAGYAWIVYDWLTTLSQEIDLIWRRRSGAWQSKLLYAFIRYHGLSLGLFNLITMVTSNWSIRFCLDYYYLASTLCLAQMYAVQCVLIWRLYVMYDRSFRVLVISTVLFAIEVISMVTMYTLDVGHFTMMPVPAPITGCHGMGANPVLTKVYWCISLAFETYLCALVVPPAFSQWKSDGTGGVALLNILIRDSLIWYFCLAFCLLLNALGCITGKPILVVIGLPATQSTLTIGGPRLITNLRAAYFSSNRDRPSTFGGFPPNTDYMQTEGTVGRFCPALESDFVDGENEDGATTFGTGACADEEASRVHDHDRPAGSPSLLVLQRIQPKGGGSRASSAPSSSCAGLCELGDGGVLWVLASDSSEPALSSRMSEP